MGNRRSDTRGEKALGLFLDHYFYPKLCEIEGFSGTQRIYDAEEQKSGIDILIHDWNGKSVFVDEKAQLHYINEPRPRFAFEVSYHNEKADSITDGWFVSDKNKTDYYILVWIDSAKTDRLNRIVEEDFNEITVALIAKAKISRYLEDCGYPIKRIRKIARDMRFNPNSERFKLSDEASIFYTKKGYDEKPINVIIEMPAILRLAYGFYAVNRAECKKMYDQVLSEET